MWIDLSSVLSQCTCLIDGQTDTFLIASPRWHSMHAARKKRLKTLYKLREVYKLGSAFETKKLYNF